MNQAPFDLATAENGDELEDRGARDESGTAHDLQTPSTTSVSKVAQTAVPEGPQANNTVDTDSTTARTLPVRQCRPSKTESRSNNQRVFVWMSVYRQFGAGMHVSNCCNLHGEHCVGGRGDMGRRQ
jgi:hypothetical protein